MLQDSAVSAKPEAADFGTLHVLYGGQRWYANNPTGKGDHVADKAPSRYKPLSVMGCFNCDKPDHGAKDWPAPYNGSKQETRRQDYQVRRDAKRAAVAQVLFELCSQAASMSDGPAGSDGMGDAEVEVRSVRDTLYQALIDVTDFLDQADKSGAEQDGQGFLPRK